MAGNTIHNSKEFVQVVSKKNQHINIQKVFKADKKFLEKSLTHISPIPRTQKGHYASISFKHSRVGYAELSCVESVRKIQQFNRLA